MAVNLSSLAAIRAFFAMAFFLPAVAYASQTWWMRGGNWADARDNYVDGWIIPSGLSASASTAEAVSKAHQIALDIKGVTDGNGCIVRMGINPSTVSSDFWWARITAAVDQLNSDGVDVILACWEGPNTTANPTQKDGRVDNLADWKTMWQKVQASYGRNSHVWFEPFNEPYGYSIPELISLYSDYLSWIGKPHDHILLDGSGYADHISTIGGSFPSCKFSLHIYPWYGKYADESSWMAAVVTNIGGYQDRTLITEMGAHATTGLDFGSPSDNVEVSFIRGVTEQARAYSMGICYWPFHRDEDTFRLFVDTIGSGVTNASLKDRLRYGWNLEGSSASSSSSSGSSSVIKGQRHESGLPNTHAELSVLAPNSDRTPQPPALPGLNADPNIAVFGDTFYLYPTTDGSEGWRSTSFHVWSSRDLINWKDGGAILDLPRDLTWASMYAWAPSIATKNGKYYFYYSAAQNVGVAVGDSPAGPFKDPLGKPLVPKTAFQGMQAIDPDVFVDDDGSAYLYWGQGRCMAVKLNDDMTSFDMANVRDITTPGYNEGPFVHKRKGKYYLSWSEFDTRDPRYSVAYATSDSPLGPFIKAANNPILHGSGPIKGAGHHSIVQIPGGDKWVIAYHRFRIPDGNGYNRETCLSPLYYAEDGSILPVDVFKTPVIRHVNVAGEKKSDPSVQPTPGERQPDKIEK